VAPERVEEHLLVECAKWNGGTDLMIATSEGFDPVAHFEAQLEALAELGLLTPDEMETWRGRFAEAGRPAAPVVVDEALRARVERYLQSLMPAGGAPTDEEDDQLSVAIEVLERLGVLTEEQGMEWHMRALRADPDHEDDEDDDDFPEYEARELRRVLLGPVEEHDGVRITSVELYDDAVVVRWNAAAGTHLAHDMEPDLSLSDDLGTPYSPTGGSGGSGGSERMRGDSDFVPGVPAGAGRLTLAWHGVSVDFEL
jgi:hypothetical protein